MGPVKLWLAFVDNDRLAVSYLSRARGAPALATRGELGAGSAYQLNIALINTLSGDVLSAPSWPSSSMFARIVTANRKGVVIQVGRSLSLISPNLKTTQSVTLPSPAASTLSWGGYPDWRGDRILFVESWRRKGGRWLWLDADSLSIVKVWRGVAADGLTVSGDTIVRAAGRMPLATEHPSDILSSVPLNGRLWKDIPGTLAAVRPVFVGPKLIYFSRVAFTRNAPPVWAGSFVIDTDSGEIRTVRAGPKRAEPGPAAVSRSGNRFALLELVEEGDHPFFDIAGHTELRGVLVYDKPFKSPSYLAEVRGSKLKNPDRAAVSPDGRHLAILDGSKPVVEGFNLPPQGSGGCSANRIGAGQ